MADRIMIASIAWSALLAFGNPFFEGRKRLIAMFCAKIIATLAYVAGGING
jgi:hypothetical protein